MHTCCAVRASLTTLVMGCTLPSLPLLMGSFLLMALAPALREGGKHGAAGTWRDASHHGYVERHHQTQWQTVKLDLNLTPSSLPEGGKSMFFN